MMALVSKYHSELVGTTHMHLAHECESRGNYRAAENHYVLAGEWKLAVKMYRSLDMWEEAYKVWHWSLAIQRCIFNIRYIHAQTNKYILVSIQLVYRKTPN